MVSMFNHKRLSRINSSTTNTTTIKRKDEKRPLRSLARYSRRIVKHPEFIIIIATIAVSSITAYILLTRDPNSLLYYGDGISHLIIARRVFDWIIPGLAQLGSVWLPMTHIMLMPFVTNNFLFHTGLAGTIVSTISTAITAVAIFRIVKLQFNSTSVGFLASALYMANTSVIYMAVVPMMEAPFMMFFMLAVYYIQKWYSIYTKNADIWKQYRVILKCAIAISAATLTRYEAWTLPIGVAIIILIVMLVIRKESWKRRVEALLYVAIPYSFLGISGWVLWNLVIFRNALEFATGPYSAQTQAISRPYRQYLYLKPINSLSILYDVAKDTYGIHLIVLSVIGIAAYIYMNRRKGSVLFSILTIAMLMAPMITDFLAMIQGSGEIYPYGYPYGWFNGRYLIFLAPLFAFASAALIMFVASKGKRVLTILAVLLVVTLYGVTFVTHPLDIGKTTALRDRGILPFNKANQITFDTGKVLGKLYTKGHIISLTTGLDGPTIMISSGISLKNFIDVASGDYWDTVEESPWIYGDYIILEKSNAIAESFDPVNKVIEHWNSNKPILMKHYQLIYENRDYEILKKASSPQGENPSFQYLNVALNNNLAATTVTTGLKFPTSMAFLGPNDILVLEKNEGTVRRIVNGTLLPEPLLDVNVANKNERGMLGIAIAKHSMGPTYVFLYYTEAQTKDGDDVNEGKKPLGNRLYRYELANNKLVNPKLLLSLPADLDPVGPGEGRHNGGKILIGPDQNIYLTTGDLEDSVHSVAQNDINATVKDGTGGILRITPDGKAVDIGVLGNENPLNKYYAYGIRNSFGMDFDPVTGKLWDTENGPAFGDEINLVEPGFNSGWSKVQGIWEVNPASGYNLAENMTLHPNNLINFGGKGKYASPKFIWYMPVGPTAIKFLHSDKLGKQYQNDIFVGDIIHGNIYHFKLNANRTELLLRGPLADKIANYTQENEPVIFASGFAGITDMEVGPDGYLYIATLRNSNYYQEETISSNGGTIYRIEPANRLEAGQFDNSTEKFYEKLGTTASASDTR